MKLNKWLLVFLLSFSSIFYSASIYSANTTKDFRQYKLDAIPSSTAQGTIDLNEYLASKPQLKIVNTTPREYTWPNLLPEVLDQGDYGECEAYALREIKDMLGLYNSNSDDPHSAGFIYGYRIGGAYNGEGMTTLDGLTGLMVNGTCTDKSFPDRGEYPDLNAKITPEMVAEATHHTIKDYIKLTSNEQVKTALMNISPVFITFKVYDSFFWCDSDGILTIPNKSQEEYAGDHAVVIVGYKYISNKLYWKVLNSWSSQWGDNGYCYMPVNYPINEYWAIVDSNESKTTPPVFTVKSVDVSVDYPNVFVGDNLQLTAIVDKKYNLTEQVKWSVSNNCATVNDEGNLTGVNVGRVKITAKYNGKTDSIYINVLNQSKFYSLLALKTKVKSDADTLANNLSGFSTDFDFNYPVFEVKSGNYYKVMIGRFANKGQANEAYYVLKDWGIDDCDFESLSVVYVN